MMTAVVTIELQTVKNGVGEDVKRLGIGAVWTDGTMESGMLEPIQALAMLDKARELILNGVPFVAPSQIAVVPEKALKEMKRLERVN